MHIKDIQAIDFTDCPALSG